MKLIEKHKQLIAWYQKKLGLSDYELFWFVITNWVLKKEKEKLKIQQIEIGKFYPTKE